MCLQHANSINMQGASLVAHSVLLLTGEGGWRDRGSDARAGRGAGADPAGGHAGWTGAGAVRAADRPGGLCERRSQVGPHGGGLFYACCTGLGDAQVLSLTQSPAMADETTAHWQQETRCTRHCISHALALPTCTHLMAGNASSSPMWMQAATQAAHSHDRLLTSPFYDQAH